MAGRPHVDERSHRGARACRPQPASNRTRARPLAGQGLPDTGNGAVRGLHGGHGMGRRKKRRAAPRKVIGAVKGCRSEWKLGFCVSGLRVLADSPRQIAQALNTISAKPGESRSTRKDAYNYLRHTVPIKFRPAGCTTGRLNEQERFCTLACELGPFYGIIRAGQDLFSSKIAVSYFVDDPCEYVDQLGLILSIFTSGLRSRQRPRIAMHAPGPGTLS